ncbi:MAG: hypothetical protein ACM3X6_02815 [Patescibacteria group bacterium]
MYRSWGSGLGQQFSEIMRMPIRWRLKLYDRLMERLNDEAEAVSEGKGG